jgi:hypothetical protein
MCGIDGIYYFDSERVVATDDLRAMADRSTHCGADGADYHSEANVDIAVRRIQKILDFRDMDSQKCLEYARYQPFPLSLGHWLEGIKLEREERRLASLFDLCTATTRAEWETLESYGTGVATDWFPNGVDSAYFSPAAEPYGADTISFVGRDRVQSNHSWHRSTQRLDRIVERCLERWRDARSDLAFKVGTTT